jgi:hypothetical protein
MFFNFKYSDVKIFFNQKTKLGEKNKNKKRIWASGRPNMISVTG